MRVVQEMVTASQPQFYTVLHVMLSLIMMLRGLLDFMGPICHSVSLSQCKGEEKRNKNIITQIVSNA